MGFVDISNDLHGVLNIIGQENQMFVLLLIEIADLAKGMGTFSMGIITGEFNKFI